MSKAKEYFQQVIDYEDKDNLYHPDQMDKVKETDIEFLKTSYRAMYEMMNFHVKNLAANYLAESKII